MRYQNILIIIYISPYNLSKMEMDKGKNLNSINIKISTLDFATAFKSLTNKERIYTYYMQRACWDGALIIFFQNSYESPALFIIFQKFFSSFTPFEDLKKIIFLKTK